MSRKVGILMSVMLVMVMVLSACADNTMDNTGDLTAPNAEEGNLGAEGNLGVEEPTEELGVEPTEAVTEEPLVTEEPTPVVTEEPLVTEEPAVEATEPVTETETAGEEALPITGAEDPSRVSTLLDYDILNANGDELGEVEDMVIDLQNNRIHYVVMVSGGFLGIGGDLIPVPYQALELAAEDSLEEAGILHDDGVDIDITDDVEETTEGEVTEAETPEAAEGEATEPMTGTAVLNEDIDPVFYLGVSDEVIENAPRLDDLDDVEEMDAATWQSEFDAYWETELSSAGLLGEGDTLSGAQGMTGTTETDAAQTDDAQAGEAQAGDAQTEVAGDFALASEFLGMDVMSSQADQAEQETEAETEVEAEADIEGDDLGDIEDIIVDVQTGEVRYFLISPDDSLELEAGRLMPVPAEAIELDAEGDSVIFNADAQALREAPTFDDAEAPTFVGDDFEVDLGLDSFWNTYIER